MKKILNHKDLKLPEINNLVVSSFDEKDIIKRKKLLKKDIELQHHFRWDLIEDVELVGPHHHPELARVEKIPNVKRIVTFNNAPYEKKPGECALCFYTKDTVIERIWNNPPNYIHLLNQFPLVLGLDFSILCNMYFPQQSFNCWRNFVMTRWLQGNHPLVVPNVGFGDMDTFSWAFDGLPTCSWLALTTQGTLKDYILKRIFLNGLHEVVRQKKPIGLLIYGKFPEEWKKQFSFPIVVFPSYSELKWGEK